MIVARLLHNIGNELDMSIPRSDRSWWIHINYLAPWVMAMCSASMVDSATIDCFVEHHVAQPHPIFDIIYPETDFPSLRLAKSASMCIVKFKPFGFLLNIILTFFVPLRYSDTHFTAV